MFKIDEIQYVDVNKNETIIVNLINGLADVINKEVENSLKKNDFETISENDLRNLKNRNYLFENEKEYKEFIKNIFDTASYYEKREIPNFLYIPSYNCNLCCSYCYQRGYTIDENGLGKNNVNEFFKYLKNKVSELEKNNKNKYFNKDIVITLMGGEPLLIENRNIIKEFVDICVEDGYSFEIITNGITIKDYIDIINVPNLKGVQLTLDGAKAVHDKRRMARNGEGTFDHIMEAIEVLLGLDIDVHLRINVDNENIECLPCLAYSLNDFYSSNHFYPYIFLLEHEGCMEYKNVLEDYVALEKIYKMQKSEPLLNNIDIAYIGKEIVDGIFSEDEFYPTTRKCSSSKNQYIYDSYGNVYKCWWGVGNSTFKINKKDEKRNDDLWKNRQISKIKECISCKYRFLCGGGCIGRMIKDERVDIQKGECHDFEKILDVSIKENYNERL